MNVKPFVLLALIWVGVGCAALKPQASQESEAEMGMQLTSTAFSEGGNIPARHTCDGENISPVVRWSGTPEGTRSYALIMDDPDAPMETWVHWVLYNIPAELNELEEGVQEIGTTGINTSKKAVYSGPCPPPGKPHRYFFKLYALDKSFELGANTTKDDLLKAMEGHVLVQVQLMGIYRR